MPANRIFVVLIGVLLVFVGRIGIAEDEIPSWFRFDPEKPYAIFDAWRELSTRKAMICLGENWQVLAGQLRNERGVPIPNSPIHITRNTVIRSYSASLQTDDHGNFIVYSPYTLQLGPRDPGNLGGSLDGCFVSATPGFPTSDSGQAFAYKCKSSRECKFRHVQRDGERAYYLLTCNDETPFNAEEFRAFESEYFLRKFSPRKAWRDRVKEPEGTPRGTVRFYRLRVVDDLGNGVPDALVKYQLSGLSPGFQNRITDNEGWCRIEEWPPADGDQIYRILTIDAPGFGVGPVPFEPRADEANIICLSKPATVTGRVADDVGNPLSTQLRISYKRLSTIAFETRCYSQPDGTFLFDRVMPNEEFRVVSDGFDIRWHQKASASSNWISLKPGVVSEEVKLQVPLASALRGVIVSEGGSFVRVGISLDYGPREDFPGNAIQHYVGTNNGPWGPDDGRFGFYGLNGETFRIRVYGWEVEPSEPIQLEPGEMRFIRVTLKKKLPLPH